MQYLTERHKLRVEALQRQSRARVELVSVGEDPDKAEPWETELIAATKALREADALPEEFECVCGNKNPIGEHVIYHIDSYTEHHADGTIDHQTVNWHRLECGHCKHKSKEYHGKR